MWLSGLAFMGACVAITPPGPPNAFSAIALALTSLLMLALGIKQP
jgi:hypothetical protein